MQRALDFDKTPALGVPLPFFLNVPLFALLAPDMLQGPLGRQKIKPRPVFHWRLPGARPHGGVVADWNRWVEVERLAADPERLVAAARETRA